MRGCGGERCESDRKNDIRRTYILRATTATTTRNLHIKLRTTRQHGRVKGGSVLKSYPILPTHIAHTAQTDTLDCLDRLLICDEKEEEKDEDVQTSGDKMNMNVREKKEEEKTEK